MSADSPAILSVKNGNAGNDTLAVVEEIFVDDEIEIYMDEDAPSINYLKLDEDILVIPDGGLRAWLVILGTFIAHVTVDGMLNSFGLFLVAYMSSQSVFSHVSPTLLSLIPSFGAGFCQIFSIFAGRIAERFCGFRTMIMLGNLVLCSALILASYSNQVFLIILSLLI